METRKEKEKKSLYINPVTDFGFKHIFSDDGIMIPFIEDVLGMKIKQLTYLRNEDLGQTAEEKKVIYDLLCQDSEGNEFIVEMQNRDQVFFSDRIFYYLSKRISSQLKNGENLQWQYGLTPVYGIFVLNFHLHGMKPAAVRTIHLKVEETGEVFNQNVTAYTLELPDYRKKRDTDCRTKTETWLYNIANMEKMTGDLAFKDRQPAFIRLQEKAKRGNLTPKEEIEYESSLKAHLDYNACLHFAQVSGIEQGIKQGREQGQKQGREQEKLSVARNMKLKGLDVELISDVTGLSVEEITKL